MKTLFRINLWQSLLIAAIVSIPVMLFIVGVENGFNRALFAGRAAAVYFLLAFILYLFLYAISHLPRSAAHKKLVVFTRIYIRFHISLAIIGTVLIMGHIIYMAPLLPLSQNTLAGYAALAALIPLLLTGYLRKRKSSGRRRRAHRYAAFVFVVAVMIHLLL